MNEPIRPRDKRHIMLSLDDEAQDVVEKLRQRLGVGTGAEVIQAALGTFASIIETVDAHPNARLGLFDEQVEPHTFQQLHLTALGAVPEPPEAA